MTSNFNPGTLVTLTATITDSTSAAFDPSTVKWHYINPAGTVTTKIYGTDAEATKTATGVYALTIYIPYAKASYGNWVYDVQGLDGSSNSLIVQQAYFTVIEDKTLTT